MPSPRFHPLLVAGAACLALAACGSDEDPPQANAPAQTAPPTQTTPTQTTPKPTTTATDDAAAGDSRSGDRADVPDDSGAPSDATTTPTDGTSGSSTDRSSRPSGKDSAGSGEKRTDGDTASAATETVKIRESLVALQEAFAVKDGAKACSYMIGIPQKADPKNPGMSCESLSQGPKGTLSEQNRTIAATAKVKVNGNEATAELGPGMPLKLRKVDGRWRVDYSQITGASASQG